MKSSIFRLCSLAMLLLAICGIGDGCASSGSTHGAYPTLKQTQMSVDWPMTRYRNGVAAGAVTLAEQQRVQTAYKDFQKAFEAAVQAAHSDYTVTTPDNVKVLANQVIEVIASIPF